MERYRIYSTTDNKFIGKVFTVDEITKTIDIVDDNVSLVSLVYVFMKKYSNKIKVSNVNYTIKGTLI